MNKLTIVMIVLALGFGGFAYLEFEGSKEDKIRMAEEAQLVGWGKEDLKSASLKKGSKLLRIEKRGEDWIVTDPLEDFADQFNANSWTGDIATEKASRLEGAKKSADGTVFWAEYGLDNEVTVLELERADGEKAVIQFAKNNAFDGSFYIRYQDSVYLGVRPWAGVIGKKLDGLRSKDVFRKKGDLTKVTLNVDGESVTLEKVDEETWKVQGEDNFDFDNTTLTAFRRQLSGLRIQSFVDDPSEIKKKKKYGFKRPLGQITATMDGKDLSFSIGKSVAKDGEEDKYYADVEGVNGYYELNAAAAKSLVKTKKDFMNKAIPFQFDLTEASSLSYKTKAGSLKVVKEGATWKLSDESDQKTINVTRVETFLSELKSMGAKAYKKRPAKGNYDSSVIIKSKAGEELFNFAWTKTKSDDSIFNGKSNLTDLGFTVPSSKLSKWTVEEFFKAPEAATAK